MSDDIPQAPVLTWNGNEWVPTMEVSDDENDLPDTMVDNFEDADAEPPGVYEDGETLGDYYEGELDSWERTTENTGEGNHALALNGETADSILSNPGDGLNRYPENGEWMRFLAKDNVDEGARPGIVRNASWDTFETGINGYFFGFEPDNSEVTIRRVDDGSTTSLAEISADVSFGEWYWLECLVEDDGTLELEVYEFDNGERGSLLGSGSASDSTYVDDDGIGTYIRSGIDKWLTVLNGLEVVDE